MGSAMRHRKRKAVGNLPTYHELEGRRLLAGDVRLALNDGSLFVRGDGADNAIEIQTELRQITVTGLDGTTVNGQSEVVFSGTDARLRNGLRANLGVGNDSISLVDGFFAEGISNIFGGPGDDSVSVTNATVTDLTIQTFTGDDSISVNGLTASGPGNTGSFRIFTLLGNDTVAVEGLVADGSGNVISTQGGNDRVALRDSTSSDLAVFTGAGNDFLGTQSTSSTDTRLITGDGDDQVSIFNSVFVGRVAGQAGIDEVFVGGANRSDDLRVIDFEGELDTPNGRTESVFNELIRSGVRQGTVSELLSLDSRLSLAADAFSATGFDSRFQADGPSDFSTVFAPTNTAFAALPNGLLAGLSTAELRNVLRFHVSSGSVTNSDLLARDEVFTLFGPDTIDVETTLSGLLLDGDARLVTTDIQARNGIIHVIDGVLLSSSIA